MEKSGDLLIYREEKGKVRKIFVHFKGDSKNQNEFSVLSELLELNPATDTFELTFNQIASNDTTINFQTRSFMGVMYFLAQSVKVPSTDIDTGRVMVTRKSSGEAFDWEEVTKQLMSVDSSPSEPENAAVAVNYRGSWFYIADGDLPSKSTFALLGQLYALQSDADDKGAPILTLPIGG